MTDTPKLPNGWEWHGGERGESYYTTNFGTEYRMGGDLAGVHGNGGYDGEVYHHTGSNHKVAIYPIKHYNENDDPVFGYAVKTGTFDSEQEAIDAVPELIEELKEEA
jgi:hypothetical protein